MRSARRAVISPMRYVSMRTPASSIAPRTTVSGSSTSRYSRSEPRSIDLRVQRRGEAPRRLGVPDEPRPSPPPRADPARARRRTRPSDRRARTRRGRDRSGTRAASCRPRRARRPAAASRRARRPRRSRLVTLCHLALGATTTSPAPVATATRSVSAATPTRPAEARQVALAPRDRLGLGLGALRRRQRLVERVDATQEAAELEPAEDLLELRAVRRGCRTSVAGVDAEVEVASHRREALRRHRLLGILRDRLRAGGRQLPGVRHDLLERPVLRDELPRGLVADPGDARGCCRSSRPSGR